LGWAPEVAIEVALSPHAASWGLEEELAFVADLELRFQHPREGRGHRDDAAGVLFSVVGLRPLEDLALVGGAANLEGLAVEVFPAQRQNLTQPEPGVGEDADHCPVTAGGFAKRCISSKVNPDRAGLLLGLRIVAQMRRPLNRLRSQTSS
jgi:hypothetical protein